MTAAAEEEERVIACVILIFYGTQINCLYGLKDQIKILVGVLFYIISCAVSVERWSNRCNLQLTLKKSHLSQRGQ